MDAYDQFWQWASKPRDSHLGLPWIIHTAVTKLPREDWRDRDKVNDAVAKLTERERQNPTKFE